MSSGSTIKLLVGISAILIFITAGIGLMNYIDFIDHTNYGTQNGLWKSVMLREYMSMDEMDYQNPPDESYITNLYYFPVYGYATKKLSWNEERWSDLQKMAIINSWFFALALAVFSILIFRITGIWWLGILGALFHFACANPFSLATNSDDIMPAYPFFLISVLFLIEYFKKPAYKWIIFSAIAYTISWSFHWTMAVGPAPAIAIAVLIFHKGKKDAIRDLALFATIVIVFTLLNSLIFGISPLDILIPKKADNPAYLGFAIEKFGLLYSGISNYLIGGFQVTGIDTFIELISNSWYRGSFIVASIIFWIIIIGCLVLLIQNRSNRPIFSFLIFMLLTFFFAQLMNVYELGSDLQFHIQPMMIIPLGLALIIGAMFKQLSNRSTLFRNIAASVIFILIAGGSTAMSWFNIDHFQLYYKDADDKYLEAVESIDEKFPGHDKTYFILRGWGEFGNWAYVKWGAIHRKNSYRIVEQITDYIDRDLQASLDHLKAIVTDSIDRGYLVLTGPEVVDRDMQEILNIFQTFEQDDKAIYLMNYIRDSLILEPYDTNFLGTIYKVHGIKNESDSTSID